MQLASFPPLAELDASYEAVKAPDYIDEELGQRTTARVALDRLERHTPTGALLDVGCWVGYLLDEARLRGWRTAGIEPSAFASAFARDRLGLEVLTSDLFGADLAPAAFDAVVMADVIEHLPNPGVALRRIRELVRAQGLLYLALPDAGSPLARALGRRWWSVIPTHVQYFTRPSLTLLLRREGWEVLELGTSPKSFSVRYYLGRVGGYSQPLAEGLIRLADRLGVGRRVWTPDFRDRMAVLARRRETS
jgi:SAM-dependent methyltransferase